MGRQSLDALRRTVTVDWKAAREQDSRQHLIAVARQGNAETVAQQSRRMGIPPSVEQYANAPGNPNIDAVKLPGPIVFIYDYRREIAEFTLGALYKASPVRSGLYLQSHMIWLNGRPVEYLPAQLDQSDEIMIANPVPYARRLEIGKTKSGRDFVLQVPNRIYEHVAKQIVLPRYRNVARVTFGYATLPDSYKVKGRLSSHYGTGKSAGARGGGVMRKRNQKPGEPIRAPAIFIEAFA